MGGILHNHRSSEVSLTLNIVRNESRSGHHHTFAEHHSEASHTNNNSGYALSGGSRSSRSLMRSSEVKMVHRVCCKMGNHNIFLSITDSY